jgi:ribosomal 30S subunit maturation factor RimM
MLAQRLARRALHGTEAAAATARAVVAPRRAAAQSAPRHQSCGPPSSSHAPAALPTRRRAPKRGRSSVIAAAAGKSSSDAAQQRAAAAAAAAAADEAEEDEEEDEWEDEDEGEDEGEWLGEDENEDDDDDDDDADAEDEEDDDDLPDPPPLDRWREEDFVEVATITRPFGVRGELRVTPLTDQPRRRLGRRGVQLWLLPPRSAGGGGGAAAAGPPGGGAFPAGGPRPPLRPARVRSGRQVRPERRGGRPGAAAWAVRLSCAPDRESAERLAGCTLLLRASDREALPGDDGEFYVQELVGMSVVLAADVAAGGGGGGGEGEGSAATTTAPPPRPPGPILGRVVDVMSGTGAHDTLRVRLSPTPADVRRSRYRTVLVPFCEAIVPRVSRAGSWVAVDPPAGLLEATLARHAMRRAYTGEERDALLARLAAEGVADDEEAERAREEASAPRKRKGGGRGRRRRGGPASSGGGGGGGGAE